MSPSLGTRAARAVALPSEARQRGEATQAPKLKLVTRIRALYGLREAAEPELPEVARSVAIIMDGSGRWARRRRLPVAAGHRAGTRALRKTVEGAIDLGVETLTVYAFSTENW